MHIVSRKCLRLQIPMSFGQIDVFACEATGIFDHSIETISLHVSCITVARSNASPCFLGTCSVPFLRPTGASDMHRRIYEHDFVAKQLDYSLLELVPFYWNDDIATPFLLCYSLPVQLVVAVRKYKYIQFCCLTLSCYVELSNSLQIMNRSLGIDRNFWPQIGDLY